MNNQQRLLCEKRHELLEFIWTWGRGCALQPLLVDISLWFEWFASAQMCRRGIRELKDAGLLKAKTWTDGRSEILILTKPALAYVSQKESSRISSFRKHNTNDSELLSVCRMMYALQRAKIKEQRSYAVFMNEIGINTIHLHMGQLYQYWVTQKWCKDFSAYEYQKRMLEKTQEQRTCLHRGVKKSIDTKVEPALKPLTLESLHRRGISLTGCKKVHGQRSDHYCFNFCVFNIHSLSAQRVLELYVYCHDWLKSLEHSLDKASLLEAQLTVYCLNDEKAKSLRKELLKKRNYQSYWQSYLTNKANISGEMPIVIYGMGLQERGLVCRK